MHQTYAIVKLGELVVIQHLTGVGDVGGHGVGLLQRLLSRLVVHPVYFSQRFAELLPGGKTLLIKVTRQQ